MGVTKVTVAVRDLARTKKGFEDTFLVDTGAIDCMAPASRLKKAGIRAEGKDVYELANGQTVEYRYGFARILFMGSETIVRMIFGPEDVEPILGVVALEDVGITVDPVSRALKKMPAKPLK
ncbi:MAG: clan AA aspartic protease [Elusimicrobia bacterium]|nr:clan AA aspartic protease [Elusimicrobiota bacterium]